ncbi:hypothetical protein EV644_12659 [Kribbella orskensis]|uniref:Uncharacterized protein n=1 Tax=Kribbella orskensis TaxID=2512216 RepID=A0ABY2B9M0_9ACTN|nr:hypothetical protein EV642_12941 [Kribbella sp. VKM Ac-2500]TCO12316.1 hypothetical protein EV644_12659 [Kribbella orskensis]
MKAEPQVHAICMMRSPLIASAIGASSKHLTREVDMPTDYNERARRLRNAVEPVAAGGNASR